MLKRILLPACLVASSAMAISGNPNEKTNSDGSSLSSEGHSEDQRTQESQESQESQTIQEEEGHDVTGSLKEEPWLTLRRQQNGEVDE